MLLDRDVIIKALFSGAWELCLALKPIVIPLIIGAFLWFVIKTFAKKIVYWESTLTGCSNKETKRRIKNVSNLIDFISAIFDIKSKK